LSDPSRKHDAERFPNDGKRGNEKTQICMVKIRWPAWLHMPLSGHHLESMLGRAKCCELDKDFNSAMEGLNQVGAGQQIPPYQQHHTYPVSITLYPFPFSLSCFSNHKYKMTIKSTRRFEVSIDCCVAVTFTMLLHL
jgi:hypothetical protein